MLQKELEDRLGISLSVKEYNTLNEFYMEVRHNKDDFAKLIKKVMDLGVYNFQKSKALSINSNGVWYNHEEHNKMILHHKVQTLLDMFYSIAEKESGPYDAYEKTLEKINYLYELNKDEECWKVAYKFWMDNNGI